MRFTFKDRLMPGQKFVFGIDGKLELACVWCPAGEFVMGSARCAFRKISEIPEHRVRIAQGFWMSQTQVTQLQWKHIMGWQLPLTDNDDPKSHLLPAEGMRWKQAKAFCNKLTLILRSSEILREAECINLPTEAQWEYACRAGTEDEWHFGNDESLLESHAWYNKNSNNKKHPVAQKKPNQWGLYDIYGNISEWCLDDFYMYQENPDCVDDPIFIGDQSNAKVVRGGSFAHLARESRSASREFVLINNPYNEPTGLRFVCISSE